MPRQGKVTQLNMKIALFQFLISCAVLAGPCGPGTVSSYLSALPCDFGSGTVQITSFSNTFGITAAQVNVSIVNHGTVSNPFFFLDIQPQSGSFGQYNSGTGTASVQLQFVFPSSPPGFGYSMGFHVTNGCCEVGGLGFSGFPGGTITESLTATTVAVIFQGGPYYVAHEHVDSSYSSTWGSRSTSFDDITSGPIAFFEFSQPVLTPSLTQTPAPNSFLLCVMGIATVVLIRRRVRR
jgi:hypothetical protein